MLRKALLVSSLAVVLGASSAAAAPPGQSGALRVKPMKLDKAMSLASAPGGVGELVAQPVTLQEAQAAAAAPGAVTIGTIPSVAPAGYSPGALPTAYNQSGVFASQWGCASVRGERWWGIPPYRQWLGNVTTWCAYYGQYITSITGNPNQWSDWFCSSDGTSWYVSGGGVGNGWGQTRALANWGCPTDIPWVTIHTHHWFDTNVNAWGNYSLGDWG